MTVFGVLISPHQVREAVNSHLQLWLPSYLAELERQNERDSGSLPPFKSVVNTARLESMPEDQLPRLILITPGTIGDFKIDEEDRYQAKFSLALGTVTSATDQAGANKLSELYVLACAAALVQHPKLPELSTSVTLKRFSFDEGPREQERSLALAVAYFEIDVGDILAGSEGPTEPDVDPADWPEVETVEVEVART